MGNQSSTQIPKVNMPRTACDLVSEELNAVEEKSDRVIHRFNRGVNVKENEQVWIAMIKRRDQLEKQFKECAKTQECIDLQKQLEELKSAKREAVHYFNRGEDTKKNEILMYELKKQMSMMLQDYKSCVEN